METLMGYVKDKVFLGLAIVLLSSLGCNVVYHYRLVAKAADLLTANNDLKQQTANAQASKDSADSWQATADRLQSRVYDLVKQQADITQANVAALSAAESKAAAAQKALAMWQAKARGPVNATCAAILATPLSVCPELLK